MFFITCYFENRQAIEIKQNKNIGIIKTKLHYIISGSALQATYYRVSISRQVTVDYISITLYHKGIG